MPHSNAAGEHVAHQFEDADQQFRASMLGMWLFLITEIMFFGGLFTAYVLYRSIYPEGFSHGSHHLDVTLGTVNTGVLIVSSFTMVMAVQAAQRGAGARTFRFLLATMALGSLFLVIKAFEYHHKYVEGLVPGMFTHAAPDAKTQELFMSVYFAMTGLHAAHMVIGVGVLAWIAVQALRGRYREHYYNPVECAGLYWHFVDIVWMFLFPLLYLMGRH